MQRPAQGPEVPVSEAVHEPSKPEILRILASYFAVISTIFLGIPLIAVDDLEH